jgi:hypothetical protein
MHVDGWYISNHYGWLWDKKNNEVFPIHTSSILHGALVGCLFIVPLLEGKIFISRTLGYITLKLVLKLMLKNLERENNLLHIPSL